MKWFDSIESPHLRLWARLVKAEYRDCLNTFCVLHRRATPPESAINYFDDAPISAKSNKRECTWARIAKDWSAAGYNPLHVIRNAFDIAIEKQRPDYPRPNRIVLPRTNPRELRRNFEKLVEVQLRSDIAFTRRCRETVEVLVGPDASSRDVLSATKDVLAESIGSAVLRHALLSSSSEKPTSEIVRAFLLAPETYIRLVPDWVHPSLLKIKTPNGKPISGNRSVAADD